MLSALLLLNLSHKHPVGCVDWYGQSYVELILILVQFITKSFDGHMY